jgi:hypothetical protein
MVLIQHQNPWDLKSLKDLQRCYYVCPECHIMIPDSKKKFIQHAGEHPLASDFLLRNRQNIKSETVEEVTDDSGSTIDNLEHYDIDPDGLLKDNNANSNNKVNAQATSNKIDIKRILLGSPISKVDNCSHKNDDSNIESEDPSWDFDPDGLLNAQATLESTSNEQTSSRDSKVFLLSSPSSKVDNSKRNKDDSNSESEDPSWDFDPDGLLKEDKFNAQPTLECTSNNPTLSILSISPSSKVHNCQSDSNIESEGPTEPKRVRRNSGFQTITFNRQAPNMRMQWVALHIITNKPWQILKQFIRQNRPYTSDDLLCFEEWMNRPKMYKQELISKVKTNMSRTYGHGTGTSFSKDFPELCQEPHCWPQEHDLKSSDWVGFKTTHLKNLSVCEQRQEWYDTQVYSWKILNELLGRDGPYNTKDLEQFEKWMKETKMYHNYIIREIKNELIKRYALGTKRTFTKDFPELCQATDVWNTKTLVPIPNEPVSLRFSACRNRHLTYHYSKPIITKNSKLPKEKVKAQTKMKKVGVDKITSKPWEILTQFIRKNRPYTSQDLICFEEWMKGPKMYKQELIDRVKITMSQTYGQGTGTWFSKVFPELCRDPHCWPRERVLKSSDWVGFKTTHLKNLSICEQKQEWYDTQVYSWKILKGHLGRDGPFNSRDLEQFEKWMKETKVYHSYIIREIKNELIKSYALGTKRTFNNDFPELCQGSNIWNTEDVVEIPNKPTSLEWRSCRNSHLTYRDPKPNDFESIDDDDDDDFNTSNLLPGESATMSETEENKQQLNTKTKICSFSPYLREHDYF